MIHGGLNIDVKNNPFVQSCCLRKDRIPIKIGEPFWNNPQFEKLRLINLSNNWDPGCSNCESLEKSNLLSMREGMNRGLGILGQTKLAGPTRIDIMFDISCNLACRTCGPDSSTFWQKHLKENKQWPGPVYTTRKKEDVIRSLSTLDLRNLRQVVFCGGETLLGQEYWDIAEWLVDHVPDAKQQLMLAFQTNGTQSINKKNYKIIDRANLVKLNVSLDDVETRFEYLRWPASWQQVTDNILELRDQLPSNVMFLVEQTISIFNVLYLNEIKNWIEKNFPTNREGDIVELSRHQARGIFSLQNSPFELVEEIRKKELGNLIDINYTEKPDQIKLMVEEIKKIDGFRNQDFSKIFPETFDSFRRVW